ncbi:MAG: EAL domain-containing protein [Selenomonadaceae bacterium]|nr:EAL domain-containing protein [Selenomonadaceae bacterium]
MLIVDDVEINRVILAQFFKDDFDVCEASNGEEALLFVEEHPVSIILLDLVMPIMDGYEFLGRLKRDERFRDIPVIATTARSESDSEVRVMEMGAADFITKPYTPAVVRSRVKNVMARMENEWRKLEQSAQSQEIVDMRRRIELDSLTNLYDRDNFCRKASSFMQMDAAQKYVIVYLDINYFKVVNDLYSVETGNLLLRSAAAFLQSVASGVGIAGRLEADHFALCMPADALNIDAMIKGLDGVVQSLNIPQNIRFYAGLYPVSNVFLAVSQMCDRAHTAMSTAKGRYTQRFAWYDDKMREDEVEEHLILRDMAGALADGQFSINIQPIFNIDTGEDFSGEVLVRWYHPLKEYIPPTRFIPIFEKNGFVARVDRFVWDEACKLLAYEKEHFGRVIPVSVNLSRLNFYDEKLVEYILGLIKQYGLEPWMLKLEITESAYTDNMHLLIDTVARFQKEGFKILMDDFGSGYSSLNMLRNMPVDILKLDMRFLEDIQNDPRARAIVKNVVNLARDIDMDVIIEGVETREQLDFLKSIGCKNIQGFLFAYPMTKEDYLDRFVHKPEPIKA